MYGIIRWIDNHILNLILGAIASIFGYFAPITGVVGVVTAVILVDFLVGVIAARKKGHAIKSVKMWRTVKKLFWSLVVVSLLYASDTEMGIIQLHKLVGFFIFGYELFSIAESLAYVTDLKLFVYLREIMEDKIEDQVNIDLEEE